MENTHETVASPNRQALTTLIVCWHCIRADGPQVGPKWCWLFGLGKCVYSTLKKNMLNWNNIKKSMASAFFLPIFSTQTACLFDFFFWVWAVHSTCITQLLTHQWVSSAVMQQTWITAWRAADSPQSLGCLWGCQLSQADFPWFGELFTSIAVVRLCHLFLFYYVSRYISVVSLMQPGVLSSLDFGHAFTKLEIIALFLAAVIPDFISIYHICLPRVPFELALLPNLWSNTPKLGRNVQACIFDMLLTSSKFLKGGSDKCQ